MSEHDWNYVGTPKLAIGGMRSYKELVHEHFQFVMNCAYELAPDCATKQQEDGVWHIRLDDNDDPEGQAQEILRGVRRLDEHLRAGEACLVTCAQGRNRSGVVIAETLVQKGMPPQHAIDLVKMCRRNALTNPAFTRWLRRSR